MLRGAHGRWAITSGSIYFALSLSLFCLRRDRSQNCEMREVWKITLESSFFSNGPSLIFSIHKWSTAPANLCVALAIALTLDIISLSLSSTHLNSCYLLFLPLSPCKMRFSDGSCSSSQKNNSTVSFSLSPPRAMEMHEQHWIILPRQLFRSQARNAQQQPAVAKLRLIGWVTWRVELQCRRDRESGGLTSLSFSLVRLSNAQTVTVSRFTFSDGSTESSSSNWTQQAQFVSQRFRFEEERTKTHHKS